MKKIENTALQMIAEASRCPDYGPDMVKSLMKKLDIFVHRRSNIPATSGKTPITGGRIRKSATGSIR